MKIETLMDQLIGYIEAFQDEKKWSNEIFLIKTKAIKTKSDMLEELDKSAIIDCGTCKHKEVSKYVSPCYGCRDNGGYDHHEPEN